MKKLRILASVLAMISMSAFLTGCGDDGDDDDDDVPGPVFAPGTAAGFQNNTYTITLDGGQAAQLTFPNANTYSLSSGGVTETGTITGLVRNGEDYIATLTPANNTGRLRAGEMRAHFTQRTANSFQGTITVQEQGGARTYPFSATINQPQQPPPQTNNPPVNTNQPPATIPTTLQGKTLQLNYNNGGGERFDFVSDSSAIYEQGTDTFSYVWDRTNTRIEGTRRNQAGANVATYDIDLTFAQNSVTNGTATVIFQQAGGSPQTDPATFTLTP